ncbi:MAG: glycosyltransferase, partial [Muribaculaceae bacterium]|nr:glycosyltransferase [Muribaculaceae bacterium]
MPSNHTPAISVLIPVYNVERYLSRCLDSVLAQSFTDFEVICVNDASPDTSAILLSAYAAADPRIRIITHPSNLGTMATRKTGYMNAKGKYIFFLDSDDYLPNRTLEQLISAARKTGKDIVIGQRFLINQSGNILLRPRNHFMGPN